MIAAFVLAAAVTFLTTRGQAVLPPFFSSHADAVRNYTVPYESAVSALYLVAIAVLFRTRKSVLDMWLLVAFWGLMIQALLITTLHSRFTVGWYGLYVLMLFSYLVVTLALITESSRLYARLALATSARSREREAQLMSLDTLVASISLEAGQPLTAVTIHARAGLNRLTGPQPDLGKVTDSLNAIIEAGRRANDVIKSMRPTVVMGPGGVSRFNLNNLARAAAALLEREMAAEKIFLQFTLDGALPLILADRIKVQRVLVSLLANAIESLGAARGRPRRITISTALLDSQDVLLEISDNGVGIAPENLERIFETFFTTKPAGAGLGLSLCRTIIDAHGGRLWATGNEAHGATFHLQLPSGDLLTPPLTPEDPAIA